MSKQARNAGVLCHISSLPGRYGIGTLGKEAYRFAELLAKNHVKYWQILPLVQTGYGDSPYSSVSCSSGNPYFIDLERLYQEKLLTKEELDGARFPQGAVDYGAVYCSRYPVLRKAFSRFSVEEKAFCAFVKSGVAEEYALFMTAKTVNGGKCYLEWDEPLRFHRAEAIERLKAENEQEYLFWQFVQYQFWKQWQRLKDYANRLGIRFIGDIPLYVAGDSADVWANPQLFQLNDDLTPKKVAGVPPDYFSAEGQLWGNPVYDWQAHREEGYAWWRSRLEGALSTYDYVRIDHFRGLDRYYEVNSDAKNAIVGEWQDGPKEALFQTLSQQKRSRIIAEDLGTIDDGVRTLLKKTNFPGMKVLLFAFDGNPNNDYLPHNIPYNSVVYTGTHDNSTVAGYVQSLSEEGLVFFRSRVSRALKEQGIKTPLGTRAVNYCNALISLALKSKAKFAIVPIQDILGLNNESRMNTPGKEGGNWSFRLTAMPKPNSLKRFHDDINKFRR